MKIKIAFSCKEAAHACDKHQYKECSKSDRMLLQFHLVICKLCREYSTQNKRLTDFMNSSAIATLSREKKEAMKQQLRSYL